MKNFVLAMSLLSQKRMLFLTRYPSDADMQDGFRRRVRAIDKLTKGINRVYFPGFGRKSYILVKGEQAYEIGLRRSPFGILYVLLIALGATVYCHSLFSLDRAWKMLVFRCGRRRIWDVHGAVPEEYLLNHKNTSLFVKFCGIERFAVRVSTNIVTVSSSMGTHLTEKYKGSCSLKSKFLNYPNWHDGGAENRQIIMLKRPNTTIVYSGGTQEWQQISKMFDFARRWRGVVETLFLVLDPDELRRQYYELYVEEMFSKVLYARPQEIEAHYESASYGFAQREDSIVNRVACPTKLIEYMYHGIIPVVQTANIGDFAEIGFQYLRIDKFRLLSTDEWRAMVLNNYDAIEMYGDFRSTQGILLKDIIMRPNIH